MVRLFLKLNISMTYTLLLRAACSQFNHTIERNIRFSVNIERRAYKPELGKATPIIDQGASVEHHATLGCDDK
jgi:hypothetical protein